MKISERYTDENHQLTTNEIVELLKENYDITTHRTTISADITLLVDFGIGVITVKSSQNKYYIGSRRFEIPELKLLIDAVQSSKFITAKKSEILVNKLTDMVRINQAETLNRNIVSIRLRKTADEIGVSFSALMIRLKHLNYVEYHETSEYIDKYLQVGESI